MHTATYDLLKFEKIYFDRFDQGQAHFIRAHDGHHGEKVTRPAFQVCISELVSRREGLKKSLKHCGDEISKNVHTFTGSEEGEDLILRGHVGMCVRLTHSIGAVTVAINEAQRLKLL